MGASFYLCVNGIFANNILINYILNLHFQYRKLNWTIGSSCNHFSPLCRKIYCDCNKFDN